MSKQIAHPYFLTWGMMKMHNRRFIIGGLSATAALALTGCSGTSLKMPSSSASSKFRFPGEDDFGPSKKESSVELDKNGLPSLKDLMKPGPLGDKWLGREDAPVTFIEFASLTCPYCRVFHLKTYPAFKKKYVDTGKVRFILREFPIGRASGTATLIMRAGGQKDTKKYFSLYHKYITQQRRWVAQEIRYDAIFKIASQVGITRKQFDSYLKNQQIIDGLKWVKQRGRDLGVSGTPTFFINGKKYREVLTMDKIDRLVAPYLG